MLREKGFEQQKLRKENIAFVVRKMTIDYLYTPLNWMIY